MPTTQQLVDWKTILEAIHAGSTVLIPILCFLAVMARKRIRTALNKAIDETLEAKAPTFKKIADESNNDLLTRINGTYVRTKEQMIREVNTNNRLDRIEDKVDTLLTR